MSRFRTLLYVLYWMSFLSSCAFALATCTSGEIEREEALAASVEELGAGSAACTGPKATQSSTLEGAVACRAVDGNTNALWAGGSVTHTEKAQGSWWRVDLGPPGKNIHQIILHNRADCCQERLSDFYVLISSSEPSPNLAVNLANPAVFRVFHPGPAAGITRVPVPGGVKGRYVQVQLQGNDYLSLAEVQVLEELAEPVLQLPLGVPNQSSALFGLPAQDAARAIDSSTNGDYWAGSVTHTGLEVSPYWQAELPRIQHIDGIELWGRTDCCASRASDYWLFVSECEFTSTDPLATAQQAGVYAAHIQTTIGAPTRIAVNRQGRYVRVQLNKTNPMTSSYLSLAGVKAFGPDLKLYPDPGDLSSGDIAAANASLPLDIFSPGQKILVVAPHQDDEAIGASLLIQRARNAGADVFVLYVFRGTSQPSCERWGTTVDCEALANKREADATLAMAKLNVPGQNLEFLRLEVAVDPSPNAAAINAAADKIYGAILDTMTHLQSVSPDEVFVPAFEGGHVEHDVTSFIVARALQSTNQGQNRRAWEYPVYPHGAKQPDNSCPNRFEDCYHAPTPSSCFQEFLPSSLAQSVVPPTYAVLGPGNQAPSCEEKGLRNQVLDTYATEGIALKLKWLFYKTDRFRAMPAYDYAQPPLDGCVYAEANLPGPSGYDAVASIFSAVDGLLSGIGQSVPEDQGQ